MLFWAVGCLLISKFVSLIEQFLYHPENYTYSLDIRIITLNILKLPKHLETVDTAEENNIRTLEGYAASMLPLWRPAGYNLQLNVYERRQIYRGAKKRLRRFVNWVYYCIHQFGLLYTASILVFLGRAICENVLCFDQYI